MFGFNCCRATALTYIMPDVGSISIQSSYAIRDNTLTNSWNNTFYRNPSPPFTHVGTYAYNEPNASLLPSGSPNFSSGFTVVKLGVKGGVYSGSAEVLEFANGNTNGDLLLVPYNYLSQKFSGIAQGTTISQAQLVLTRDSHVANPPIAIQAIAKVWDTASSSPPSLSVPWSLTDYPWSPINSYGGVASFSGISFLAGHLFSVSGSPIVIDITDDVQTIINKPSWSSTNCRITVLIYTVYPQFALWINNIHPSGNYPNYPASNTAVWFSDYDPTIGAHVRIAI